MFAISISGKELIYRLNNFYTSKIKRQSNGRKWQKYVYGYVIYINVKYIYLWIYAYWLLTYLPFIFKCLIMLFIYIHTITYKTDN